ncbi:HAAS signaling domain-containing protein [Brevundimonas sp.]|uniref:HAAS signaling domain-containing protein n=1 Tax=Brevundimonas sp. TaxID=1871086 RepID=UPI00391AE658
MTLTEKYLKAVAAQLPAAGREDVIAELRDALMSRMEDREAALGRPLTEAEEEAVLREMGHPLAVAARFGAGPHHVVGPELYPWWLFGVKTALTVLAIITVIGAVVRVVVGDVDGAQALGQAIHGLLWSGMMIVGVATVAGFIIERMKDKPAFLTEWRARDLGLFEMGVFSSAWMAKATDMVGGERADGTKDPAPGRMSPTAGAVASGVGWGVFVLWWTGVIGREIRPGVIGGELVVDGVDYGLLVNETVAWIWWPLLAFAAARAAFHLMRAVMGSPVRFTAFGDVAFSAASLGFIGWFWLYSPMAPVFAVDTLEAFVDRVRLLWTTGEMVVPTVIMMITAFAFIGEVFTLLGAAGRFVTGRDGRKG